MTELEFAFSAHDQKEIYKRIRNYLAGRFVGATRDSTLLEEVTKCLFCRSLAINTDSISALTIPEALELARAYRSLFAEIKTKFPDIFDNRDEILLDPDSIKYVNDNLAFINIFDSERDPIGDAYEAFASSELRAKEGQFFTPENAVKWLVEAVDPRPGEAIIDPACGAGGFLSYAAKYLKQKGASVGQIAECLHGLEKDRYLAKLARIHVSLITSNTTDVKCADSLALSLEGGESISDQYLGKFDVVLANPPFGSKIVSASDDLRRNFELSYKWKYNKFDETWERTEGLASKTPPQVLFIERILDLLKSGGRAGIVVPESLVSSRSYAPVIQYIRAHSDLKAVIGMPESLFKSSGKGGTHTKTCLLVLEKRSKNSKPANRLFMAEAKWCGHDSRGRMIPRDDLPTILKEFQEFSDRKRTQPKIGYRLKQSNLKNNVLAPRYYDPSITRLIKELSETHQLLTVGELVEQGLLKLTTGNEIGKLAYGTGEIPFVRTSDISNWEIKFDPKHCVSEDYYSELKDKQDVRELDILMVRDGTYLIGTCAIVTRYDVKILYQSHIYKIRSTDFNKLSPYLLLAVLSSEPVQAQIKSKRFTQDIIDSIGNRLLEVILPIPRDASHRERIEGMVKKAIFDRMEARELAKLARELVTHSNAHEEKLAV